MLANTILAAVLLPALAATPIAEDSPAAQSEERAPRPLGAAPEEPQVTPPSGIATDRPLAAQLDEVPPPPPPPGLEPPAPPAPPQAAAAPGQPAAPVGSDAAPTPDSGNPPRMAIGLSLGANTISANGLQLLWRASPHLGWALGGGIGSSGLRYGFQGRFYFQPLVSSPYLGVDLHGNTGAIVDESPRHDSEGNETGGTFGYTTEHSELFGLSFGWHLVWGHFFLDPTVGWSVRVAGGAYLTDPSPGTLSDFDREKAQGDRGGPQLGLTGGFTW